MFDFTDDSFRFILKEIRERPGLYLGEKSLKPLEHYWHGYETGANVKAWENKTGNVFSGYYTYVTDSGEPLDPRNQYFMYGFDMFVHSHYNRELGAMGSLQLIQKCSSSDEEAFDKFFELLDEFLKQKGLSLP